MQDLRDVLSYRTVYFLFASLQKRAHEFLIVCLCIAYFSGNSFAVAANNTDSSMTTQQQWIRALEDFYGNIQPKDWDLEKMTKWMQIAFHSHIDPYKNQKYRQTKILINVVRNSFPQGELISENLKNTYQLKGKTTPWKNIYWVSQQDFAKVHYEKLKDKSSSEVTLLAQKELDLLQQSLQNINYDITDFPTVAKNLNIELPPQPYLNIIYFHALLKSYDPHSGLISKKDFEQLLSSEHQVADLGLVVVPSPNGLIIEDVLQGSAAEAAGLKSGDYLVEVENQTLTFSTTLEDLQKILFEHYKNIHNKTLQITIERQNQNRWQTIKTQLQPKKYTVSNVSVITTPKSNTLRILSFTANLYDEVVTALKSLPQRDYLILDLRNNGGGNVNSALLLADLFIDEKTIPTNAPIFFDLVRGKEGQVEVGKMQTWNPEYAKRFEKMIVLVNERSASASEIVASIFKHSERALVVGETTFGKGTEQSVIPLLKDKLFLKITTGRYFTYQGFSPQWIGVTPHLKTPSTFNPKTLQLIEKNSYKEKNIIGSLPEKTIVMDNNQRAFKYEPSAKMQKVIFCAQNKEKQLQEQIKKDLGQSQDLSKYYSLSYPAIVAEQVLDCLQ